MKSDRTLFTIHQAVGKWFRALVLTLMNVLGIDFEKDGVYALG